MKTYSHIILTYIILSFTLAEIQTYEVQQPLYQWREVQKKAKDTVVQIFSFRFELNILEPYLPPHQSAHRGSGFFIKYNGNIYIVTNAHVVDQASGIHVRIPSLGQYPVRAQLISICHDRDLALLMIENNDLSIIKKKLGGTVPYLELGNSNDLYRGDQVVAIGYPLGQESFKITAGVFCGQQQIDLFSEKLLQIDAPINPGSSGGPLLNIDGKVIGINTAIAIEGQNVGYSIPVNLLEILLPQMIEKELIKKPSLGIMTTPASEMAGYLGNPEPSGVFVSEVIGESTAYKAGIRQNDMMYSINGYHIDKFGDIVVPWSEDRISIMDYISQIPLCQDIAIVVYRNGVRHAFTVQLKPDRPDTGIKRIYPGYEPVDYEIFAGMICMELSINHIMTLGEYVSVLKEYYKEKNQKNSVIIVTHVLPTSELFLTKTIGPGVIITHVNELPVKNLTELREAFKKTKQRKYLTVKARDTVSGMTDNIQVALKAKTIIQQEGQLAEQYGYTVSPTVADIIS